RRIVAAAVLAGESQRAELLCRQPPAPGENLGSIGLAIGRGEGGEVRGGEEPAHPIADGALLPVQGAREGFAVRPGGEVRSHSGMISPDRSFTSLRWIPGTR